MPLRAMAVMTNYAYDRVAYRVRHWGAVPRRRGPTLIVANHQHDLESMVIVTTTTVERGPWRHPVFTASSRRMYEPGFLAARLPWLRLFLRRVNAGPLFVALGMLPLENELSSRAIAAFSWSAQRRHGTLALAEIFDETIAARFPSGTTSADLWRRDLFDEAQRVVRIMTVREPYRREILDETRAGIADDLARMEEILANGATFYLTPEGHYTSDGRMLPMRGVVERLAPLATIYLAGVSYDPFVARRLSMLYRVVELGSRFDAAESDAMSRLTRTLAANRPITTSLLLGAWMHAHGADFTLDEAVAAVDDALAKLPPKLFVEPELRRNPRAMVRAALPLMAGWNILEREGERFRLAAVRRHPQFPHVDDILAFQANFLEETLENAGYARE